MLAADPKDKTALVNIGVAYMLKGDSQNSIAQLREAVRIAPDLALAHYSLALALKGNDELETAKAELLKTLALDSDMAEAHYTPGIAYWQGGDFDGTVAQMKEAIRIRKDYGEAWFIMGTALKQKGDLAEAITALREASRLRPDNPGPWNTLGQALRIQGDAEGSKAAFALAQHNIRPGQRQLRRLILVCGRQQSAYALGRRRTGRPDHSKSSRPGVESARSAPHCRLNMTPSLSSLRFFTRAPS